MSRDGRTGGGSKAIAALVVALLWSTAARAAGPASPSFPTNPTGTAGVALPGGYATATPAVIVTAAGTVAAAGCLTWCTVSQVRPVAQMQDLFGADTVDAVEAKLTPDQRRARNRPWYAR